MNKKALECLYEELPGLVSEGVMPQDVAERIRSHYGPLEQDGGTAKRWAIILFSVLGAVLIGGGIILLLAHNWDELSRPMRAAVSVAPLLVAQALGAWFLFTNRPGSAWREGIGAFQTLAIGASIALVAQTYNLGGQFDEFILTWSLLALPIAYLLESTLPAVFYLIGITVWAGAVNRFDGHVLWYFAFLALALPFLGFSARSDRYHPRALLFGWIMAITLCIGTGIALDRVYSPWHAWPVLFATIFGLLFLVGARWWSEATSSWQRPLQTVGALGTLGLSLILSFRDPWPRMTEVNDAWRSLQEWELNAGGLLGLLLFIAAIYLWIGRWLRGQWLAVIVGAAPLMTLIGWAFARDNSGFMGMLLFNCYLALLGVWTLAFGLRRRRLGVVNAGMFVLSALILCRFFDSDLGFLLRGVAFILIGVGFLATNLVLLRWKGESKA